MAKVNGPLLSFGASGQLARTLVFSRWKGIALARQYVVPSNPNSSGQSTQRGYFTEAVALWHDLVAEGFGDDPAAWARYAGVLGPMSGFNAFVRDTVDEKVAGHTVDQYLQEGQVLTPTHNALDASVEISGGGTPNITLWLGNTKTFFPVTATQAAVAGVATFNNVDTGFGAGDRVYLWFECAAEFIRTGLYTALLT